MKYHHWLWATQERASSLLLALGIYSPEAAKGISLVGKVEVQGNSFTLACLHGTNFSEKEWAVFCIQTVFGSFETIAIPCLAEADKKVVNPKEDKQTRVCRQTLKFLLGDSKGTKQYAGVYKVSSGRGAIPLLSSNSNLNEWLCYRCIEKYLTEVSTTDTAKLSGLLFKTPEVVPVLTVPGVTFDLTNDHFWPSSESFAQPNFPIPAVKCHLVTEFASGISISTYVDRYDFLHQLIRGYIDYLQEQSSAGTVPLPCCLQ